MREIMLQANFPVVKHGRKFRLSFEESYNQINLDIPRFMNDKPKRLLS